MNDGRAKLLRTGLLRKTLLITGFLLLLLASYSSSVVDEDVPKHYFVRADQLRDYEGHCLDAERCSLKKEKESWTIDNTCERATCYLAPNGTLVEKRTRCDPLSPLFSEDCYIVRIEGKPFPDCCPRLFCDEKAKNFFFK